MPLQSLNSSPLVEDADESNESPPEPHEQLPSPPEPAGELTWEGVRYALQQLAMERGHYHGYPLPDDDCELIVHPRFPLQSLQGAKFKTDADQLQEFDEPTRARIMAAMVEFGDDEVINHWFDHRCQRDVLVMRKPNGKSRVQAIQAGPGRRINLLLSTIGVARRWELDAEWTAMEKLATLVPQHLFHYYALTGTFLERSPRSNVLYIFRRCRPTLAIGSDERLLCAMCLHPIGYYNGSFGGAMVPTDDVIAHLLLMRGDEHHFWKCCNQHSVWLPEAGL